MLPWSTYIDAPVQNTTIGDPFATFYPRRQFFIEAIRAGEMPFWNPYMLGGYPAVGDTNAQTFYPLNWLVALCFSPARSFSVLAWFHLSLTGILMFGMLRSHGLRAYSSVLGAVSWMLSGILVVWLEHPHRLSSFAWLPGLFWAFNLSNRQRRAGFSLLAGLLFALMFLGGQPQYAALGGLLLALYAVLCSFRTWSESSTWNSWPIRSLLITALIGLGIGSLQLLPAYDFTLQSHREPRSLEAWLFQALPLRHLSTFWLPDLFGSAEVGKYPYWGELNYVEYTFYFGLWPLMLTILAPLLGPRRRISWLWAMTLILTTLVAVGSPLAQLARWIPGMTYFSLHRMMSHVPFLGSWLAALGLDAMVDRSKVADGSYLRGVALGTVVLLAATGIALYTCRSGVRAHWEGVKPELLRQGGILAAGVFAIALMRWRHGLSLLMILGLTAADLFFWGHTFNPVSSLDLLYPDNEVTRVLQQDLSLYRVLPLRNDKRIFGENVLSVFHISTPDGYLALTLRHHKELMYTIDPYLDHAYGRFEGPHINLIVAQTFHPLHGMLNVKYVLSSVSLEAEQLRSLGVHQGVHIYENREVLPRAYVTHRAHVVPEEKIPGLLTTDAWDFHTEILISEPLTPKQAAALEKAPERDGSLIRFKAHRPNQVRLTAKMEHAGFLVLADPFCRGWHATVDGRSTTIVRANHALRAVFLDPGEHDIRFFFLPRSVSIAIAIAAGSCIFALILAMVDSVKIVPSTVRRAENVTESRPEDP